MQADILDRRPDNREATGLGGEHVDLISSLPHIAEKALNSIGGLNVPMHALRKRIKRQQVLFVLRQTSYCFWIALSVLGFEGRQLGQRLLFAGLLPDANEFDLHIAALASRDGVQDVALLVHQTALARSGGEQLRDSRKQSLMAIRDDEVDLGGSSLAQVLQEARPPIFVHIARRLVVLTPLCCLPDRRLRRLK